MSWPPVKYPHLSTHSQICNVENLNISDWESLSKLFPFLGALVHVLHWSAAAIRAVECIQWGHQVEHLQRHYLPEPDIYDTAHQLQQLQAANEQQGLELWQVKAVTPRTIVSGSIPEYSLIQTSSCPNSSVVILSVFLAVFVRIWGSEIWLALCSPPLGVASVPAYVQCATMWWRECLCGVRAAAMVDTWNILWIGWRATPTALLAVVTCVSTPEPRCLGSCLLPWRC